MTQKFFTRLESYFFNTSKVLRGESDKSAIFPNPSDIGDTREDIFAQILRDHLPVGCVVSKGGFLFNLEGDESKQIDILINSSQSLRFNFDPDGHRKTFSCVDGCIGVVSVKSDLSRANLIDALDNLASIPRKSDISDRMNPMFKIKNYSDWPYKAIFASKGASCDLICNELNTYYAEHPEIPDNLKPDLVYVAGKYFIENTGYEEKKTRKGTTLPAYTFNPLNDGNFADIAALPSIVVELQNRASAANQIVFRYDSLIDNLG